MIATELPPNDLDIERQILGAMLISTSALEKGLEIVLPQHFYHRAHRHIYSAMAELVAEQSPVDQVLLCARLRQHNALDEAGGVVGIAQLSAEVATGANLSYHAKQLEELYRRRQLIELGQRVQQAAADPGETPDQAANRAEVALSELSESSLRPLAPTRIDDVLAVTISAIHKAAALPGGLAGLSTGIGSLDRLTSGLVRGHLVIVAGRPGSGKTSLATGMGYHVAVRYPAEGAVLIFSLEMSREEILMRMLSTECRVNFTTLRSGGLSEKEWRTITSRTTEISERPIFIDDQGGQTIDQIRAKARNLAKKTPLSMVIIDYLQLMSDGGGGRDAQREQEISRISRGCKALAKELNVPIVALSQLNRAMEIQRRRPQLSDLRESGSLEQDADTVLMLYDPLRAEKADARPGEMELLVTKNRFGALGAVNLGFEGAYTRFYDLVPTVGASPPHWHDNVEKF